MLFVPLFLYIVRNSNRSFMFRQSLLRKAARDSLNAGSSMTYGSKGAKKHPGPQRRRMPWTASKEYVPGMILRNREKMILDGKSLVEADHIERGAQVDPLEVLQAAVARYEYNTSTGMNLFQLTSEVPHGGRGMRVYRKEWQEGTYDKYVTLTSVELDRDGVMKGVAHGYVTFHGESTLRPIEIDHADVPGWHLMEGGEPIPPSEMVPPPVSVGTEVPVDPSRYRLRAYPYYDAPNPPEFVEKLLKDRGVIPDVPVADSPEEGAPDTSGGGAGATVVVGNED
ncbi:hypothetical protein AGDE_04736 [Angomonas deanei]|nr:hypothetical protein AGDE_04736 [Angomonas deanei]|eukprot:EPY39192.1 hypothetical protein AGDE_04736 [Angomonas deanei]